MQNSEGGRKLNQAMVSTGRAVATTGRAVGQSLTNVYINIDLLIMFYRTKYLYNKILISESYLLDDSVKCLVVNLLN